VTALNYVACDARYISSSSLRKSKVLLELFSEKTFEAPVKDSQTEE